MKKIVVKLLAIGAVVFLTASLAAAANSPLRVLFIGNSYTGENNLPGTLNSVANDNTIKTSSCIHGGYTLEQQWNWGPPRDSILHGGWDYVVIQPYMPNGSSSEIASNSLYVTKFDSIIRQVNAATCIYAHFGHTAYPTITETVAKACSSDGVRLNCLVVHVGRAYEHVIADSPAMVDLHSSQYGMLPGNNNLVEMDGNHPGWWGQYLAACLFYATFTQASPVGRGLASWWNAPLIPQSTATYLQQTAWETYQAQPPAYIVNSPLQGAQMSGKDFRAAFSGTGFSLFTDHAGSARISAYDIRGRKLICASIQCASAGKYSVELTGAAAKKLESSNVCFVLLEQGQKKNIQKLIIDK
jgi:hypothetical protein